MDDAQQLTVLEERIERLLAAYCTVREENRRLVAEQERLHAERHAVRVRLDALLAKVEGVCR